MIKACLITLITITSLACHENKEAISPTTIPNEIQVMELEVKPFSNPRLIYGSSFGELFSSYYKQSKYKEMLCFTSNESVRKFSRERISQFYQTEFNLGFETGKLKAIQCEGRTTNLIYLATVFGTKKKIILPTIIENDSVKLVLTSLHKQW